MTTAELYRYAAGLSEIGQTIQAGDIVYAGEIPMAAMAEGDRLRMLAYPGYLAERLRQRVRGARLSVRYSIPDWASNEAIALPGHPFNLTPAGRTYRRQPDPETCDESRALHWEALFDAHLRELTETVAGIDVEIVRASELTREPGFRAVLRLALNSPSQIQEALREAAPGIEIVDEPLRFAGAECRKCGAIRGSTTFDADWDRAQFHCEECGNAQEADIREQHYWMQDDVQAAAVHAALKPAVALLRHGTRWEMRGAIVDSLLLLAIGDGQQPPTRLMAPSVDSEVGGTPLRDLIDMAKDWDESVAELP